MTKQVRQSIAPTHILGSTGTVEGSDLGFRSLTTFPFPNMPTVAGNPIVQRGSNSDGAFVRFADGTQFARSPKFTGQNASTANGDIFRSSGSESQNWSYPASFQAPPVCFNEEIAVSRAVGVVRNDPGSTFVNLGALSGESEVGTLTYQAMAFGRWF